MHSRIDQPRFLQSAQVTKLTSSLVVLFLMKDVCPLCLQSLPKFRVVGSALCQCPAYDIAVRVEIVADRGNIKGGMQCHGSDTKPIMGVL